jgi:hypothetical protein
VDLDPPLVLILINLELGTQWIGYDLIPVKENSPVIESCVNTITGPTAGFQRHYGVLVVLNRSKSVARAGVFTF